MAKRPDIPSICFARIPVCDRNYNVLAYELVSDLQTSTSGNLPEMIAYALTDPAISDLLNQRPALILSEEKMLAQLSSQMNFPLEQFWLICSSDQINQIPPALVKNLKKRGARFGLHLNSDRMPDIDKELRTLIGILRAPGEYFLSGSLEVHIETHWMTIATDVDSKSLFEQLNITGVNSIQGAYLPHPEESIIKRFPSNKLIALEILNQLSDINVPLEDLEKLIIQDLQLYYKLLRFINSAYYSFNRKINSIKEALIYLGLNALRSLTLVIALSETCTQSPDLFYLALTRARMSELLAEARGWPNASIFFNAGLISLLDILLDIPMGVILSELPLNTAIKNAVLHYEGRTGAALQCAMYYENVDWQKIEDSQFEKDLAHSAYLEASRWATALQQSLMAIADSQEC
ncbi:EAL and HDOD domain-containing protein [Oceanospirillum sediminis]|uniref:HDOD domain-containing protein n=1 Tax=Oceanospirillum sediminis TaxID=2760088 RepID=A0A839IKT2_9GAMM|nr:HDOD domain-containing protein [Oceanospirillum sediminis]MBB1485983.1 HDOD domain-containing protein [Oceanospirillum sediminis]